MREIRHEDNFDEAILPDVKSAVVDISKSRGRLETPTLTSKNKHDQTRKGFKSDYREDENED